MTDVTVLFEQSDGVEPGVEYSCRVNLEVDGDNSGWSYPVSITTVTVLGELKWVVVQPSINLFMHYNMYGKSFLNQPVSITTVTVLGM